jgi:hypothetical protein
MAIQKKGCTRQVRDTGRGSVYTSMCLPVLCACRKEEVVDYYQLSTEIEELSTSLQVGSSAW